MANTEKTLIRKALTAINAGNASALKQNIREALLSKVRKALNKKENEIAKGLIEAATKSDKAITS